MARALYSFNWWKRVGGSAGRSERAGEYCDESPIEGATYADLPTKQAPVAIDSDTGISTGLRFSF